MRRSKQLTRRRWLNKLKGARMNREFLVSRDSQGIKAQESLELGLGSRAPSSNR